MKKLATLLLLGCLCQAVLVGDMLLLTGCAAKKPVVGTANQFDSDSYLVLVTADATIKATKDDLTNDKFPADMVDDVKVSLNFLIDAYDRADKLYLEYHNAALNGTATQQQQDAVSGSLPDVQTGISSMSELVKVKK